VSDKEIRMAEQGRDRLGLYRDLVVLPFGATFAVRSQKTLHSDVASETISLSSQCSGGGGYDTVQRRYLGQSRVSCH
jgi:hypothetical protein